MKNLLIAIAALFIITGCTSSEIAESMPNPHQEVVEDRLTISTELNATYCQGEGFEKYLEREKYYTFTCKNGAFFNVPK